VGLIKRFRGVKVWDGAKLHFKIYLEGLNLPIPDFQTFMRPLLEFASDSQPDK
jgi:hypothetical protein